MKFTLSWLKEHLDTDASVAAIADKLTMIGLEVESLADKAHAARAVHDRARHRGEAASERRPAARLHGRHRRGRSGAGRVRRAQCAHRHDGRVRAARRLHPRQGHHARASARSAASRATACWSPRCEMQLSEDHEGIIELPADAPVGEAYVALGRARRSRDRDQAHAQPARLHRRPRRRARPRRRRHGQVPRQDGQAGEGRRRLPAHGHARLRRDAVALPRLCAAAGARREERPVARLAAEAPDRDRAAPDQCAGRHHQLHHLRPRPPAACVRRRQGEGQSRGAARASRASSCSRSTARPTRSTTPCA